MYQLFIFYTVYLHYGIYYNYFMKIREPRIKTKHPMFSNVTKKFA